MTLSADLAELHGDQIKTEEKGGQTNIGYWDRGQDWASWKVRFAKAGKFKVSLNGASQSETSEFVMEVAGQTVTGKAANTGSWDKFDTVNLGLIEIKQAGDQVVKIRPKDEKNWKPMNLRGILLQPVE